MESANDEKIEYLTKRLVSLENEIQNLREKRLQNTNHENNSQLCYVNMTTQGKKITGSIEENQEEGQMRVSDKMQSYAEGLTIHGLSRIATGSSLSKLIWSVLVVASFSTAVWISKEHWDSFLRHDVKTHTTMKAEHEMKFPAITICDQSAISFEQNRFEKGDPKAKRPISVGLLEQLENLSVSDAPYVWVAQLTSDYAHFLGKRISEPLNIDSQTNCFTVKGHKQTIISEKLVVTIKANRTFDRWTQLLVTPENEPFPGATSTIYWAINGYYNVVIKKRLISRLGKPHSECVDGKGTYEQNKFIGNYTVNKCKKGCFLEKVFEKCGAIPPMYERYMRNPGKFDNFTNTVNDTVGQPCLWKLNDNLTIFEECNNVCHLQPCFEEDIKLSLHYHSTKNDHFLSLAFTYDTFLVDIVNEKPVYTWQDLFANFGGCVGLMTGASILSVVELFFFVGLILIDLFEKYTRVDTKSTK
ncbi:acid-sensing ion channel 2-like [Clytia hemisphaerica]|uniref:acid-sensing ion channel 2-like n=1 Tax=Clytia hemisphaerica TaxID=252671 RepID=UPI0034D548FB